MTLALWMIHAAVVGLLLAAAAWCLDRALVAVGLPSRGVWLAALVLSLALPGLALVGGSTADEARTGATMVEHVPSTQAHEAVALDGETITGLAAALLATVRRVPAAVNDGLARIGGALPGGGWSDGWLALGWLLASAATGFVILLSARSLRRQARSWPRMTLRGHRVRISPALGPAVLGLIRPEIVLPARIRRLPDEDVELVLTHEGEHLRARDPALVAFGLAVLCLVPWSPAAWWMHRRLRHAMELDCDRRVLRRGTPARRYGKLLLDVGSQPSWNPSAVTALARSPSLLERRLNAMKTKSLRRSIPLALVAGFVGVGLAVLACETDAPTAAEEPVSGELAEALELPGPTDGVQSLTPLVYVDGELRGRVVARTLASSTSDASEAEQLRALVDLEPGDAARIEVLKGEAARALYGRDAEAGVIQMFTREGEERAREGAVRAREVRARVPSERAIVTRDPEQADRALVLRGLAQSGPTPLLVIDGVIVDAERLDELDPTDIESIEVVRGEAAARLFGSRGENGVVQITTVRHDG